MDTKKIKVTRRNGGYTDIWAGNNFIGYVKYFRVAAVYRTFPINKQYPTRNYKTKESAVDYLKALAKVEVLKLERKG